MKFSIPPYHLSRITHHFDSIIFIGIKRENTAIPPTESSFYPFFYPFYPIYRLYIQYTTYLSTYHPLIFRVNDNRRKLYSIYFHWMISLYTEGRVTQALGEMPSVITTKITLQRT